MKERKEKEEREAREARYIPPHLSGQDYYNMEKAAGIKAKAKKRNEEREQVINDLNDMLEEGKKLTFGQHYLEIFDRLFHNKMAIYYQKALDEACEGTEAERNAKMFCFAAKKIKQIEELI